MLHVVVLFEPITRTIKLNNDWIRVFIWFIILFSDAKVKIDFNQTTLSQLWQSKDIWSPMPSSGDTQAKMTPGDIRTSESDTSMFKTGRLTDDGVIVTDHYVYRPGGHWIPRNCQPRWKVRTTDCVRKNIQWDFHLQEKNEV